MIKGMEEEVREPIENQNINIEYELPKLYHRVLANLIDAVIFFLLFVTVFIPTNLITTNSRPYKNAINLINTYRLDSGLFIYENSTKTYIMWTTYYDNYATAEGYVKQNKCEEAIDHFINFIGEKLGEEKKNQVQADYDEYRLSLSYENEPYFVKDGDQIVSNKVSAGGTCTADSETYYKKVYHIYMIQNCGGYLTTLFPEYYSATKLTSNLLFFLEIPVAFALSAILTYLVPPLIFRRGRKTIGKLIYRVGLVDSQCLSPSLPRFLARFGIFFVLELALSFVTFGIPFIISFTMMAFSKRKQGFPDYMLGLTEISTVKHDIYFNKYEASILQIQERKSGISFHMKKMG